MLIAGDGSSTPVAAAEAPEISETQHSGDDVEPVELTQAEQANARDTDEPMNEEGAESEEEQIDDPVDVD